MKVLKLCMKLCTIHGLYRLYYETLVWLVDNVLTSISDSLGWYTTAKRMKGKGKRTREWYVI